MGTDPKDGDRRVVRVAKTSHDYPDAGLSFTIASDEQYEAGYVTGLAASDVSTEDLTAGPTTAGERSEREEARELLGSLLATGPIDTNEVMTTIRATGLSDSTVKRARRDLGVTSTARKDSITGRLIGWELALPDHPVSPESQRPSGPVDPLDATWAFAGSGGPGGHPAGSVPLDGLEQSDKDAENPSLTPTMNAPCPICKAPPPWTGSFGTIACAHQIEAGLT